jgi:phage tail tape-measure protein
MPMVVSGTLNEPVVRPSGSALAGAAVGTAILGPGLGTAIGVRVGGFLNKLFGKKDGDKNSGADAAPHPPEKK